MAFQLKAEASDKVGNSFSVLVPNDPGPDELLKAFVAEQMHRTDEVFVKGTLRHV